MNRTTKRLMMIFLCIWCVLTTCSCSKSPEQITDNTVTTNDDAVENAVLCNYCKTEMKDAAYAGFGSAEAKIFDRSNGDSILTVIYLGDLMYCPECGNLQVFFKPVENELHAGLEEGFPYRRLPK